MLHRGGPDGQTDRSLVMFLLPLSPLAKKIRIDGDRSQIPPLDHERARHWRASFSDGLLPQESKYDQTKKSVGTK